MTMIPEHKLREIWNINMLLLPTYLSAISSHNDNEPIAVFFHYHTKNSILTLCARL